MFDAVDGGHACAQPAAARQQSDAEGCPGALEADAVEVERVELGRRRQQLVEAARPGGDGVGFVEAADVGDLVPQPFQRGVGLEVGEHELRPAGGRTRRGRPVRRALVEHLPALADIGKPIAAEQRGVDAFERVGRHRTGEANPGAALLAERQHAVTEPRGDEVERLGLGV